MFIKGKDMHMEKISELNDIEQRTICKQETRSNSSASHYLGDEFRRETEGEEALIRNESIKRKQRLAQKHADFIDNTQCFVDDERNFKLPCVDKISSFDIVDVNCQMKQMLQDKNC